jgi:hypothetical protein
MFRWLGALACRRAGVCSCPRGRVARGKRLFAGFVDGVDGIVGRHGSMIRPGAPSSEVKKQPEIAASDKGTPKRSHLAMEGRCFYLRSAASWKP